jgi:hypothetical protein
MVRFAETGAVSNPIQTRARDRFRLSHRNHATGHQSPTLGAAVMHKEGGSTVETPVEARAGFLDRPTLSVLIVSIGLTIGLFALVYISFFAR